jgi:hypothetical protein
MKNYKWISELHHVGQQVELPDGASKITVRPTRYDGLVQVTYLAPVRRVQFEDAAAEPEACEYIN